MSNKLLEISIIKKEAKLECNPLKLNINIQKSSEKIIKGINLSID